MSDFNDYENETIIKTAKSFYELVRKFKIYNMGHKNINLPSEFPTWGICILFERGEVAFGGDKITYVSFNRADNNVGKRLADHFLMGNGIGRRSSFRNHIACALVVKNKEELGADYEKLFDLWSGSAIKRKSAKKENPSFIRLEKDYEILVDKYLEENFSFCVIPFDENPEINGILKRIVATLARCRDIKISKNWLGNFSEGLQRSKIGQNGIWNIKYTKGEILTSADLKKLAEIARRSI